MAATQRPLRVAVLRAYRSSGVEEAAILGGGRYRRQSGGHRCRPFDGRARRGYDHRGGGPHVIMMSRPQVVAETILSALAESPRSRNNAVLGKDSAEVLVETTSAPPRSTRLLRYGEVKPDLRQSATARKTQALWCLRGSAWLLPPTKLAPARPWDRRTGSPVHRSRLHVGSAKGCRHPLAHRPSTARQIRPGPRPRHPLQPCTHLTPGYSPKLVEDAFSELCIQAGAFLGFGAGGFLTPLGLADERSEKERPRPRSPSRAAPRRCGRYDVREPWASVRSHQPRASLCFCVRRSPLQ